MTNLIEGAEIGLTTHARRVIAKLIPFLCIHLLHAHSSLPVDAITNRLAAAHEHRERPDPRV